MIGRYVEQFEATSGHQYLVRRTIHTQENILVCRVCEAYDPGGIGKRRT